MRERLQEQFDLRSSVFDESAAWITDPQLLAAHVELAGKPGKEALDICCGTGQVGRALKKAGWKVQGLDLSADMAKISGAHFPVQLGRAEDMPFEDGRFGLAVCRQSFQFLDATKVLAQVSRVLAPGGRFLLSLTVPFSEDDEDWLRKIHLAKQPLLRQFLTSEDLRKLLQDAGFRIEESRGLRVRESIDRWMRCAPELTQDIRKRVASMVQNAPAAYRAEHRVETREGEVFEDWNWVVLRAAPHASNAG